MKRKAGRVELRRTAWRGRGMPILKGLVVWPICFSIWGVGRKDNGQAASPQEGHLFSQSTGPIPSSNPIPHSQNTLPLPTHIAHRQTIELALSPYPTWMVASSAFFLVLLSIPTVKRGKPTVKFETRSRKGPRGNAGRAKDFGHSVRAYGGNVGFLSFSTLFTSF